jgi:putative transposase
VRYGFIAKHRAQWPVRVMCRVLQVSASGFYEWDGRSPSPRSAENEKLTGLIQQSFAASDRTYGSRRVWQDLREWGHCVSVNRVARLMAAAGLVARRKRRRSPGDSAQATQHTIAPNLLQRQFEAEAPNRRWLADFTYIWTAEGWLYLAVVLDLFSRRIVGWSMKEEMTSQLVIDALLMAIWRRGSPKELLHHSDQGSLHQRRFPARAGRPGDRVQHEPPRRLLGQRRDGKLLLHLENRARLENDLSHQRSGPSRRFRLHRALLQSSAASLDASVPQSNQV